MSIKITIFTPTYNRAYIIENLYNSLKRQTNKNFEWLVVDDGSTDNTEELFNKWMSEENDFPIRYYKKENGGKCRAINTALDLAKGKLFFTVDSDDYLTDDAVEKINKWFLSIKEQDIVKGVVANRGFTEFETENYIFSEEYLDKSLLDMYTFYRDGKKVFDGERAFVFFTDFHRKYKYPEFENENFMTEAVVWNRMANDGYKMRFYNDIIWVYEYKEDGLTMAGNSLFTNNPHGYGLWLKEKSIFMKESLYKRFRLYYTFTCELYEKYDVKTIAECIGAPTFLIIIMLLLHKVKNLSRKTK